MKRILLLMLMLTAVPTGLALAQADLSGMWSPVGSRGDNPLIGDYGGLPLSEGNRLRAESWAADMMEVAEWVCRPFPLDAVFGPEQLYISKQVDNTTQQVIAYRARIFYHEQEQTIWMDARPHPPDYALHTWTGFSTGEWEGDTLLYTTTHLKESFIQAHGPVRSDRATIRTRFRRYGDYLTAVVITYDPAYLTEPFVRTESWVYNPQLVLRPYPCEEATETLVPRGKVPHYLPGRNPMLTDFAARSGIPPEAALGGAETMYPDYIKKMKTMKMLPRATEKSNADPTEVTR